MQDDQLLDQALSSEQVSEFLRKQPHFFEKHAHLLTEIYLPSPHGNGAISLTERQQLAQRDKIRALEAKLAQLMDYAEENEAISQRVQGLAVKLLGQQNFGGVQQTLYDSMQQDFNVTETTLLLWQQPGDATLALHPAFTPVATAFSDWVLGLATPYSGPKPAIADNLVAAHLQSFAFIPLPRLADNHAAFGVLILGSDSPQKFQPDMGGLHLQRIGELAATAVLKYIV